MARTYNHRRKQIIRLIFVVGALITFIVIAMGFIFHERSWEPEEIGLLTTALTLAGNWLGQAAAFFFRRDDDGEE